jgi:hypothetical protein
MFCRSFFLLATRIDKRINPIECEIESGSLPRILLKTVQTKIYETFADRWYLLKILLLIDIGVKSHFSSFKSPLTKRRITLIRTYDAGVLLS